MQNDWQSLTASIVVLAAVLGLGWLLFRQHGRAKSREAGQSGPKEKWTEADFVERARKREKSSSELE